jgi:hypothetical protein
VFKVEFDSKLGFKGLPKEFESYASAFTPKEIEENPKEVLMAIEKTINRPDEILPVNVPLPSESKFQEELESHAVFL